MRPPVICVVGKKKSGKTTTVVGLVAELVGRGVVVMTAKHGHGFRLDHEGTDSWRHRHEAGAARVVMSGPDDFAVVGDWGRSPEASLEEIVDRFLHDADVVIAEGFKSAPFPRIEVYRRAVHEEAILNSEMDGSGETLALLTDTPGFPTDVPIIDVDGTDRFVRLADLVQTHIAEGAG